MKKYTAEGRIGNFEFIHTEQIHEVTTREGLHQQKKRLSITDLFDLVDAKRGDIIRITIEKL